MKVIYNKYLPLPGFIAMLTLFVLWVREEHKGDVHLDAQFFNHEKIHCYQQVEIWGMAVIVIVLICLFFPVSWYWLLATPLVPLGIYCICWVIELFLPPYNRAYGNICFESEAIYNEADLDYLKRRGLFTFRFLKYISNRKYPYKPKTQRHKLIKK